MLHDFTEPVCRACCNYEGLDKIAEVIEKARRLRRNFEHADTRSIKHSEMVRSPQENGHAAAAAAAAAAGLVSLVPSMAVTRPPVAPGVTAGQMRQMPAATYANIAMIGNGTVHTSSLGKPVTAKPVHHHHHHQFAPMPGISQANFAAHMQRVSVAVPSQGTFLQAKPIHFAAEIPTHDSTTQRFAQIQDTLNTLSKAPPFRVRFSKDHSLVGRVIAFDAVCRGSDYELKVFIEYPIGSQNVFQSASGAGRQMYGEFRERLGIGGGFRGASSNGYKDLEFERLNGEDEWRVLGELLTEEVRFFRGPPKKDLLPTPHVDPKFPNIPPATLSASRGFIKHNIVNRKRQSSNEDEAESPRKERRLNGGSTDGADSPKSPPQHNGNCVGSPTAPAANGVRSSRSPTASPRSTTSSASPPTTPNGDVAAVMQCLLCHRTLEDTRYVRCPSESQHKFCFSCSRGSITKQSAASSDVYCPSGMKCFVTGSSTPWAFMEQEIATILEASA